MALFFILSILFIHVNSVRYGFTNLENSTHDPNFRIQVHRTLSNSFHATCCAPPFFLPQETNPDFKIS